MKKLIAFLIVLVSSIGYSQKNPIDFVPDGYFLFDNYYCDLNKDGVEDCVVIIKGTDKSQVVNDGYGGEADRNRRGVIMLLKKDDHYEVAVENHTCLASDQEDGGVYFAPELDVSINKGNIYFNYLHGRYGSWTYTFRYQNSDLALIGYDSSYRSNLSFDYVTFDEISVNFLSKKKLMSEVTAVDSEGEETIKESWINIEVNELVKLSKIQDINDINFEE